MAVGAKLTPAKLKAYTESFLDLDITATESDELFAEIHTSGGTIIFASEWYDSIHA